MAVSYKGNCEVRPFLNSSLPSEAMSCTAIKNEEFIGYLVHIHNFFVIDPDLNIATIVVPQQNIESWTKMAETSIPILIPTAFGYVTSDNVFCVNFDELSITQNEAASLAISRILDPFNFSGYQIEAADLQQIGSQLVLLFVAISPAANEKEAHAICGNIPYDFAQVLMLYAVGHCK